MTSMLRLGVFLLAMPGTSAHLDAEDPCSDAQYNDMNIQRFLHTYNFGL